MLLRINSLKRIAAVSATGVLFVLAASRWNLTEAKDQWERAYTGDGSVIELNTSTLKFARH